MKRLLLTISLIAGIVAAYTSCEEQEQTPEIIKVESVSIDQEDITLTEGESVTLTATVLPEDAVDKAIAWSSSNDDIVMIASNGKAKAMAVGEAVITAKAGEQSDFITISVVAKTIPVTGISLNPSSITMKVGESQTITAEVTPQNATDKSVTWESSNPEVASVDNGTVLGLKPGSVTIMATTVDGSKTADCAVTIKSNLAPSVTVDADHISAVSAVLHGKANLDTSVSSDLMVGFQYSTSSGILPSNSVTIEALDADSQYNYSAVIAGLNPGAKYYYRSVVRQNSTDTYGETKEFTTKDISSVLEALDASDIGATEATLNSKLDLTDVHFSSLGYGFLWGQTAESQTNNLSGGAISNNAFATALSNLAHKTKYWFKSWVTLDGNSYYSAIKSFTTSVIPVTDITLDRAEYTFHTIGDAISLAATVTPCDATDSSVEWSSDKPEVATVNSNGQVTAVGNGSATITVTTNDQNKTAACAITVSQWVTGITLNKTSLTLLVGENETLSVTNITPSNAYDNTYTWYSSDESVATIYSNGKVVAVSAGTAQIRATANDGSGVYAACAVIVKRPFTFGPVDLGLPSGLKWANANLGANAPEEYGDYYAWGEIEPYYNSQDPLAWKDGKTGYNWASYKWCNGSYNTQTKYCTNSSYGIVDNKTVLEPADDAAYANLGGNWRMPTDEEWTELKQQCAWTWTEELGINGIKVTGPNGSHIFLPAAGYHGEDGINRAGVLGKYWSSSLTTKHPSSVWCWGLSSSSECGRAPLDRFNGLSVRPVTD